MTSQSNDEGEATAMSGRVVVASGPSALKEYAGYDDVLNTL